MNTETAHALYQRLAITLTALLAHRANAVSAEEIQEIYQAAKWSKGKQQTNRTALDKSKDFLTVASEFSFAVSDALDSGEIDHKLWESLSEMAIVTIPALMQPQGIEPDGIKLRAVTSAFLNHHRAADSLAAAA